MAIPPSTILSGQIDRMKKISLFLSLLLIIFYSCKKEIAVQGPAGPGGEAGANGFGKDTGTISGNLALYNEFTFPVADSGEVVVTLSSGSFQQTTSSDAHGHYSFSGITLGTYNLSYQKAGFGTMKVFGLSHFPGGPLPTVVQDVALLQLPVKTAIRSITGEDSHTYYRLRIMLDTSSNSYLQFYGNLVVLYGNTPDVSPSHYLIMHSEYVLNDPTSGGYTDYIDKSSVAGYFKPGDTVYVTACTYSRYVHKIKEPGELFDLGSSGYYIDPADGRYVYPNISQPAVALTFQ